MLKEPAPQVYLDEYADNSINFSMTYWVEMTETGDTRRVKSDLLLMIDRAFTDAGISIPFPQRDVHLSTAQPVPVQIVGSAGVRSGGLRESSRARSALCGPGRALPAGRGRLTRRLRGAAGARHVRARLAA